MEFPIDKVEKVIEEVVSRRYLNRSSVESIYSSARTLSDNFTRFRAALPGDYLSDPSTRAAYLLHFTLTNAAKAHYVLKAVRDLLPRAPVRILDLGSGPAPSSIASALFFKDIEINVTMVDQNEKILDDAKAIYRKIRTDGSLHTVCGNISTQNLRWLLGSKKYDIIFASNLLNELMQKGESHRIAVHIVNEHLSDKGFFIAVDPALRETARSLMETRNIIVEKTGARVVSPCLHNDVCPMLLSNDRDWCHFYIEWKISPSIKKMDEAVGTDHTYLKLSYVAFQKGIRSDRCTLDANMHRVVSSPLFSKGKVEVVLCGYDGKLRKVRRLTKDSSNVNSDLESVKRGDVVYCTVDEKIAKDSVFKIRP